MYSPILPTTTQYYSEPGIVELSEETTNCEVKQDTKFSIDFDTLERLLANEEEDQGNDESQPHNKIRHQNSYRFHVKSDSLTKSQRIILCSSSFDSTLRASSFKELGIHGSDLPHIFSDDAVEMWWMDVQNPSEKELRLLCSAFRVHPLTVEDILNQEIQEKIEDFTNYYFTCFRSYRVVDTTPEKTYKAYTIYMVVFRTGTLSFCFSDSEHAAHVLNRIELLKDYLSINSDWIFYAFVDDIVDSFNPSINLIEKRVNEIEDQVYTTRKDDKQAFLYDIEEVRKSISSLLRLLSGKTNVLSGFEKHHCDEERGEELYEEENNPGHNLKLYINDVKDHITSMLTNLLQFESLLARSQKNYLAGLAIDNLTGRQRVNELMSKMAVISMILTLLNLICGLFGTNVNATVPLYANSTPAWFIIIGSEIVLALALLWLARRLRWY